MRGSGKNSISHRHEKHGYSLSDNYFKMGSPLGPIAR